MSKPRQFRAPFDYLGRTATRKSIYRYAVAGLNEKGEGGNSNELTVLFVGELPSSISSNMDLMGTWLCTNGMNVSAGATLSIHAGTVIKLAQGVDIVAYGRINAFGTPTLPVEFTSNSASPSVGDWGKIILNGSGASGSTLNYVNMQYGYEIDALSTSNITIQNSNLENTINGIYYHSGGGIICQAGSYSDIWQNTISGFNWGIGAIWGSSPRFRNVSDAYGAYWGSGPVYWLGTGCFSNYSTSPLSPGRGPEPTPQQLQSPAQQVINELLQR